MWRPGTSELERGAVRVRDEPMPRAVKLALAGAVGALLSGAVVLALVRGPAILIDLAGSVKAFLCM